MFNQIRHMVRCPWCNH